MSLAVKISPRIDLAVTWNPSAIGFIAIGAAGFSRPVCISQLLLKPITPVISTILIAYGLIGVVAAFRSPEHKKFFLAYLVTSCLLLVASTAYLWYNHYATSILTAWIAFFQVTDIKDFAQRSMGERQKAKLRRIGDKLRDRSYGCR